MFYYYIINFTITRNDIVLNDAVYRMKSLINHVSSAAVPISPLFDDVRAKLELNTCARV